MDAINQMIAWLEQNWGTVIFGTVSLSTVATTLVVLIKQWISNKVQGTKYDTMWAAAQKTIGKMEDLYNAEKAKNADASKEVTFLKASQTVLMDTMIKMALASKLDSDDKASIVANVERLKLIAPKKIVQEVKETTEAAVLNVTQELNENPAQTVVNIVNTASSLLDKYSKKKE